MSYKKAMERSCQVLENDSEEFGILIYFKIRNHRRGKKIFRYIEIISSRFEAKQIIKRYNNDLNAIILNGKVVEIIGDEHLVVEWMRNKKPDEDPFLWLPISKYVIKRTSISSPAQRSKYDVAHNNTNCSPAVSNSCSVPCNR